MNSTIKDVVKDSLCYYSNICFAFSRISNDALLDDFICMWNQAVVLTSIIAKKPKPKGCGGVYLSQGCIYACYGSNGVSSISSRQHGVSTK